ncbi:hypothetical protein [Actinopolyspora mortivallis]|uniref:hypothetical protein n=1 Tax=Actinopolyspora mortivallis TaxID=33906 RepID=UPI0003771F94|nr:hypothetical protein [Actinopolyspora mortivallis]
MSRLSPVTTILLRECAGIGLAVAGFAYSIWVTVVILVDLVPNLAHPEHIRLGPHTLLATLDCLSWWTGIAGLRLGGWHARKAATFGLALIAVHTFEVTVMGVVVRYA